DRCQGAIGHDGALLSDALHQIDDIASAFDVMDAAFAPCGQDVAAEDALGVYPGCRPCTALAVLLQVLLRAGLYGIAVALGCFGLSGLLCGRWVDAVRKVGERGSGQLTGFRQRQRWDFAERELARLALVAVANRPAFDARCLDDEIQSSAAAIGDFSPRRCRFEVFDCPMCEFRGHWLCSLQGNARVSKLGCLGVLLPCPGHSPTVA